jgi:pimeloyl-ACP methyl ester carboxylesterase
MVSRGDQRLLVDKDLVRFQAWLSNTSFETIEYDGTGHMLYQNAPEQTAADVRGFMDRLLTPAGAPAPE